MSPLIPLLGLLLCLLPLSAEAASRFAVCTTTCTWDAADTSMWSATSGGATGASVPTSADTVTLDAATCVGGTTCTITVNTTVNVTSITGGACTASTTGCVLDFSANNNSVTVQTFDFSGTGTRTLNMGNGTWTVTTAVGGNSFQLSTVTNLTFNANSSTLVFSGNGGLNFQSGGRSFNVVTFNAVTNGQAATIVGGPTIATLNVNVQRNLQFANGSTTTITNGPTIAGTSGSPILLESNNIVAGATIAITGGSPSITWAAIRGLTFTTTAITATNSLNLGGNSGITITPPSTGGGRIIGG